MIATLKTPDGRTAELQDDGTWESTDGLLRLTLNVLCDPRRADPPRSQALPGWGHDEALRAQTLFPGELVLTEFGAADVPEGMTF
jgi:hypothetical protein